MIEDRWEVPAHLFPGAHTSLQLFNPPFKLGVATRAFGIFNFMINAIEAIRSNPTAKTFEIGDLLFAQFRCPLLEEDLGIWTHTDHFLHVISSKTTWRTSSGTYSAEAGETVFFKKGAYILPQHFDKDLCVELFFVSDALIKETVMDLAPDLPLIPEAVNTLEQTIYVKHDVGLSAFLHSMALYFAAEEKPSEALLKLKVKELLTSILVGQNNIALSAYLRSLATNDAPSITTIMEANFTHNLTLNVFAQLCHRSLSTFKRDFRKVYGTSPGKWLLERRLQHSLCLLQSTGLSITQITYECGFEDLSHFSRTFKIKFGQSPNSYRESLSITA
jgi:AraC family transcriptional regulator, exoenzyme S synthesis regulatory protein ExsA